ncbi:MAG: prolyl oligopeptidase family serine peptidase, partial [bacterium]
HWLIGPGVDPAHPGFRQKFFDKRSGAANMPPLACEVAASLIPGGYQVEMRMPWRNLGIDAKEGVETALTVWINDVDKPGELRYQQIWFPSGWATSNTKVMYGIRLAKEASPAVEMAVRGWYHRLNKTKLDIAANGNYAGKTVSVLDGDREIGTAVLAADGTGASAMLSWPMPPRTSTYTKLSLVVDKKTLATVNFPDAEIKRQRALYDLSLKYTSVFSEEKFPTIDFTEPLLAENLIGEYEIKTSYYDRDYLLVTRATKPGRYGAVVKITGQEGQTHRRYITLYRQPGKINWDKADLKLTSELPAELGIDPAVAKAKHNQLNENLKWRFVDSFSRDDYAAQMLAGMSEMTPETAEKTDTDTMNQAWWFGLRKKLGLIEHRYVSLLPEGYDKDNTTRYPLILFLHGAGERGVDLSGAILNGPHAYLKENRELPFICISALCPPNTWWYSKEVNDLLDEIMAKYRVDPDRVYLTGLSMGGFGSWDTACAYPNRFAAVVPICGGGNPADAPAMRDIPTWVFHGAKDTTVPITRSQEMVDALSKVGGRVKMTTYPEAAHNAWTVTYINPELYQWFLAQRRGQPTQPRVEVK